MAEATQLNPGIRALIWIPVYAAVILGLLVWTSYKLMAQIFKWMTLGAVCNPQGLERLAQQGWVSTKAPSLCAARCQESGASANSATGSSNLCCAMSWQLGKI
jgi:hypothetical protein